MSVTTATQYTASARYWTARNPNDIARIVVSVEPMTEKKPLTAQAHATYDYAFGSFKWLTTRRPRGMNRQRQRSIGNRT